MQKGQRSVVMVLLGGVGDLWAIVPISAHHAPPAPNRPVGAAEIDIFAGQFHSVGMNQSGICLRFTYRSSQKGDCFAGGTASKAPGTKGLRSLAVMAPNGPEAIDGELSRLARRPVATTAAKPARVPAGTADLQVPMA